MWRVELDAAMARWELREHPPDALRNLVVEWLAERAERADPSAGCVKYPNESFRYEARLPNTRIFVEFYLFPEIDLIEIAAGSV